jgi:hypothetical protein
MDCRHFFCYGKGSLFTKKPSHYHGWWLFQKNQPFTCLLLPLVGNSYDSQHFTHKFF